MEKDNKQIETVNDSDQDKVKTAISRWNKYLFSKESDKNLFDYFLESTKKTNLLNQYPDVFLEHCIVWAIDKLETMPMHHNMRLKQSFQFLVDNVEKFNPKEDIINKLCEKSVGFKRTKASSVNYLSDNYAYFSQLSSLVKYQNSKENEIIQYMLEKVLEKCSVDKILDYYQKVDENLLNETSSHFSNALLHKIEKNPEVNDEVFLSVYYMENKIKQVALLDNLLLSDKIKRSELLTECWSVYTEAEKENVIGKSLMLDSHNTVLENLSGYKQYVKDIIDSDLIDQNIIHHSNSIKNKKKIELYFSLLEQLYENTDNEDKNDKIQHYAREMYLKIIAQKRPDLTKGLIDIKAEKSIIKTEDVPLFVYQIMETFPKIMAYHLVMELLDSVKKVGKIKEFSEVFNTSKSFQVGRYSFEFSENMKNEIKYIYHEYLTEKFKEEKKHIASKPAKRLKI